MGCGRSKERGQSGRTRRVLPQNTLPLPQTEATTAVVPAREEPLERARTIDLGAADSPPQRPHHAPSPRRTTADDDELPLNIAIEQLRRDATPRSHQPHIGTTSLRASGSADLRQESDWVPLTRDRDAGARLESVSTPRCESPQRTRRRYSPPHPSQFDSPQQTPRSSSVRADGDSPRTSGTPRTGARLESPSTPRRDSPLQTTRSSSGQVDGDSPRTNGTPRSGAMSRSTSQVLASVGSHPIDPQSSDSFSSTQSIRTPSNVSQADTGSPGNSVRAPSSGSSEGAHSAASLRKGTLTPPSRDLSEPRSLGASLSRIDLSRTTSRKGMAVETPRGPHKCPYPYTSTPGSSSESPSLGVARQLLGDASNASLQSIGRGSPMARPIKEKACENHGHRMAPRDPKACGSVGCRCTIGCDEYPDCTKCYHDRGYNPFQQRRNREGQKSASGSPSKNISPQDSPREDARQSVRRPRRPSRVEYD